MSRTSAPVLPWALASELTKTWMPSLPENAVSPRSETMNHWVASRIEIVIEVLGFLRLRHHHVDAGRNVADRLIDRKGGGNVSVSGDAPIASSPFQTAMPRVSRS